MRLPHITIEYQEEETYALGKVSFPLIMGFGIHWLWVYLFLFNGSTLFYPQTPAIQTTLFPLSLLTYAVTLLCYGVFLEPMRTRFSTARKRHLNRLAAALCMFTSMLLAALANALPFVSLACGIASGVLSGCGSAVLLMSYGVSFSVCDLPTTAICTAVSLLIGTVCYACVSLLDAMLPFSGALICLALPFIEVACLHGCSRQLVDSLQFTSITNPIHPKPFSLAICLPSLVFGFALGFVRTRAVLGFAESGDLKATALSIVAAGALASVLLVLGMLTQRKADHFSFRILMPVTALLIASLSFSGFNEGFYPSFALFCSYLMLESCLWIMYADISQRFRISAFSVFGFGRGTLAVGTLASYLAAMPGCVFEHAMTDNDVLIAILFVSLVLGLETLPSNTQIRRTLKRGRYCPAFIPPNTYEVEEAFATGDLLATAGEDPVGNGSAGDQDAASDGTFSPSPSETSVTGGKMGQPKDRGRSGKPPQARTSSFAITPDDPNRTDAAEKTETHVEAAAASKIIRAVASEKPPMPKDTPNDIPSAKAPRPEAATREMGRFKRKCAIVAERYLLSKKETEVLFLLAKGYKSSTIQERLYISEGTANTHMRHIYRKLDVHSQLELMNLIEAEKIEIE